MVDENDGINGGAYFVLSVRAWLFIQSVRTYRSCIFDNKAIGGQRRWKIYKYFYAANYRSGSVTLATTLRTQGATTNTVGKATGQTVITLCNHRTAKSGVNPWFNNRTAADTTDTMIADSKPPKSRLL
jgi:hypothetical protein